MPLPVLTWNQILDQLVSVSIPTYDVFLNAIETLIGASTHWRINAKNLDVANSRGWIEFAPKSTLAGVTEGRVLLLFSTGTVAGTAGNERPLTACRNAPWAIATTSLSPKMWIGFSDNANSALTVGPASDPWTSATPYGSSTWSKLFPMNALNPGANCLLSLIESAEGFAICWSNGGTGSEIQYLIAGRLVETVDGETGYWMATAGNTSTETGTALNGWQNIPTALQLPPLGHASIQHSTGSGARAWGAILGGSGVLYGCGRTQWHVQNTSDVLGGMSSVSVALFLPIILGGGPYSSGSSDGFLGIFRQVRWGPAAYRGQSLISGGVTQGLCLNYAAAGTGAKPWGLWFDNFR